MRKYKILIFLSTLIFAFLCLFFVASEEAAYSFDKIDYVSPSENSFVSLNFSSGEGTLANPYLINNSADMNTLSAEVAAGNAYQNVHFKVANGISNIVLGNFVPIGSSSRPFKGNFNGNGANFELNISPGTSYRGLFGYMEGGTIENLSVSGIVQGTDYIGGIVGYQRSGTVKYVYNTASITLSASYGGGIVGYIYQGNIDYSYNKGTVTGNNCVGGIVGYTYGSSTTRYSFVTNSYNSGLISGTANVGGIIGHHPGSATSGNVRSNLYYDLATIANYLQPAGKIKPTQAVSNVANTTTVKGLSRGQLLNDLNGFDINIWQFDSVSGSYGYYPQLRVFSENSTQNVVSASKASTEIFVRDGLGTSTHPFLIRNVTYINDLKTKIKSGNTFEGFYYKMQLDGNADSIDLGNFEPIGISSAFPFYGSFDGNDVEFILDIDTAASYQGLFGYFGLGTINNLSIKGSITAYDYVGGVVGYMLSGTVSDVYNLADITARNYVGGIVGNINGGKIERAYNAGDITATASYIGGIIGYVNYGEISYLYNMGEIWGVNHVGGLIGYTNGYSTTRYSTVSYGYNAGPVSATGASYVGGVIGYGAGSTTSGNSRQYLYYDLTVMVNYTPPSGKSKPVLAYGYANSDATYVKGLDGEKMLGSNLSNYYFNAAHWIFTATANGYAYYPQLKVFGEHNNNRIVSASVASVKVDVSGGLGTPSIPFLITSLFDMTELSRRVLEGNTFLGFHFKVADGISSISLGNFTPIGNNSRPFKGAFNGNGVNFELDIEGNNSYRALFGYIDDNDALIENLSVSGTVRGSTYVGSIVAYQNKGTVKNVYNTASIIGTSSHVGGIVGYINNGLIDCVYNIGSVLGYNCTGGIVGYTYGYSTSRFNTVSNAYCAGTVAGTTNVGGIIGHHPGSATSGNVRSNLYYDLAVIANYLQPSGFNKPTQAVGNIANVTYVKGLDTGEFLKDMTTYGLSLSSWQFDPVVDKYAYYPQLKAFSQNDNEDIVYASKESVKMFVGDGIGTPSFPFIIRNIEDLENLKIRIKSGNTFQGFHFKVQLDDDANSINLGNFEPIGSNTFPFYGSFDGNNVEFILDINNSGANYQGLFGYFGVGKINNLSVRGSVIGNDYVGGVVGYMFSGTLMEVYNLAEINGRNYVGGIIGYLHEDNTVQRIYNAGKIVSSGSYVGGNIGYINKGNVSYLYNVAEVSGVNHIGGLVGYTNGYSTTRYSSITYGYNSGTVAASNASYCGGVIGYGAGSTTSGNLRQYLYYDLSVIFSFNPPSGKHKPSQAYGYGANTANVRGVDKSSMIGDNMTNLGFNISDWAYKDNEGRWAFYPQLRVFAFSDNIRIANESEFYVRTIPFSGAGTEDSPYIISTVADFMIFARSINNDFDAKDTYYMVSPSTSVFDLSLEEFFGVGGQGMPFNGHFDGTYANFIIDINTNNNFVGLFCVIGVFGSVKNLSVSGTIIAGSNVGTVAGLNQGAISYVYSTADIRGTDNVGGLIGNNEGSLYVGYNRGTIVASGNNAGGIIGYNAGTITEVYNGALVNASNYSGGVVGFETANGSTNKAYYDTTVIQFYNPASGVKPSKAISNKNDTGSVTGRAKEYIHGIGIIGASENQIDFTPSIWTERESNGMYDYYLQISLFAQNINSAVSTKSLQSVRSIRFTTGTGIESDPFIIFNKYDMKLLSDISVEDNLAGMHFKVAEGVTLIDLTDEELQYKPIGTVTFNFRGIFDGNNAQFRLSISDVGNYSGLFGRVGEGSIIKNLSVSGDIRGLDYVGGIAGYIFKTQIINVYNEATIAGSNNVGGLIGYSHTSTITNSYNLADVEATANNCGGISGYGTLTTISYTYNFGVISGVAYLGGIIGRAENNTKVLYSYNRNNVIGSNSYVGGIIGYLNNGILDNCYSAGTLRGVNQSYIGGLIGRVANNTAETNSYYDLTIIEADMANPANKPIRSIGNKLDQNNLRGIEKAYITGDNILDTSNDPGSLLLKLNPNDWVLVQNNGIEAYYPQLKVFAEQQAEIIRYHSIQSVCSYIFAGKGEEFAPYIIINENDMRVLSILVELGNSFAGIYFRVRSNAQEFDLSTSYLEYKAIGNNITPFNGHFNGNGINFLLDLNGENYVGLFGYLGEYAKVYQFSVSGTVNGSNNVGSIAGYNKGEINTVYSIAKVYGTSYVGGIVGHNAGILNTAYYIAEVAASGSYSGGLIGYNNQGNVSQGYAAARISGQNHIGGVIGYQSGTSELLNIYYNKSITEIHKIDISRKPAKAVSNLDDTDICCGVLIEIMTSGLLGLSSNALNLNSEVWTPLAPFAFDIYYPQITYFSNHALEKIKFNSKSSVTVDRFTEGDGSENDPYIIRTAMDMKAVSDLVMSLKSLDGKYFKVADDIEEIDLTDPTVNYYPIGIEGCYFQGNFNGNGANFVLNLSSTNYYMGLFGFVGSNAIIRNVSVSGNVTAKRFAAGIAGRNRGLIENCSSSVTVHATEYYAGGIAGYNENAIRNCYNTGNVSTGTYHYAGGITGYMARDTLLEFCYNTGNIISGNNYAGGIAGYSQGKISNTYSAGQVHGINSGGIIGATNTYATTFNSYYDLTVIIMSDYTRKPLFAVSNKENTEDVKGVVTSQISGESFFQVYLDQDWFVLKPNEGYTAYYPQLKVFANNQYNFVKERSLLSVTTTVFKGEGNYESPYILINEADIKALSTLVKQQVETAGVHFKLHYAGLILDLTYPSLAFTAIGNNNEPFNGVFLGNSATFILDINTPFNYQGLFGYTGYSAVIQDFTVKGRVFGGEYTGSVAGYNNGIINNVISFAEVAGMQFTGGIAGFNNELISNSYFEGKLTASGNYSGGITGNNSGDIIYCFNFGEIKSNENYVGGLTGRNTAGAIISNSFNHGNVICAKQYAAGIAAVNNGTILRVYNTSNISSTISYAAGIVALNSGDVEEGYHSGKIMTADYAGGIASSNTGSLQRLYYNTSETERVLPGSPYILVTTAVFNKADTEDVKGLTLDEMTGHAAIGNDNMDFSYEYWALKEGYDFVSYFPEMIYFRNHETEKVREYSLISVTDKKFEGTGTSNDPYLIYDGYDMKTINEYVIKGNLFIGKHFRVADGVNVINLTFPILAYIPIGNEDKRFGGILDGKGANFILDLDNEYGDYQGIFHTLGTTANVFNFIVSGQVIGKSYVGAVAGRCFGTIENVTNFAVIKSFDGNNVGGITGFNEGSIKNCINKGNINMTGTYGGGIAGENSGSILDCYNKANVKGITNVGGIAGRNFNTIKRAYNAGEVIAETQAGGIVGENDYLITHCFNMGKVRATIGIAGGISGAQRSKGDGTSPDMYTVYNTGIVTSVYNLAGGIVGHLISGRVMDAYNSGEVSCAAEVGAIIGQNENGNVQRCYYDKNMLEKFNPVVGTKPNRAIGNQQDTDTVKGLYRGQMAGGYSIGSRSNQMNFYYPSSFMTTPSFEEWSFYPQIKVFAESEIEEVRVDSLESVRGLTFIVGSGTEYDPYIIMNESDMIALAETVNTGNQYIGKHFLVHPNIAEFNFYDEDGCDYTVIGNLAFMFNGSFNGNGANFNIKLSQNSDYVALFGHIGESGTVYNLSVSGEISGNNYTAGIAALNNGTVRNVYNMAKISGKNYTAGIVAINNSDILNVYNRGEITGLRYTAGISGYMDGYVTNSYNSGVIYGSSDVGAIVGFLNIGLVLNSYYDTRILGAYRSLGTSIIKPEKGVSNSPDSETVKGLDKQFMIGTNAIGNGDFQMYFSGSGNWGVDFNIDGQENYPQLRVFSRSTLKDVRDLSKESTLTDLYIVSYDYNGATENNSLSYSYVLYDKHYQLVVPFKFGFVFTGWYYLNQSFDFVKYTDSEGLSLQQYGLQENISLIAQWEVAYHEVNFYDGDNNLVHSESILHGDYVQIPDVIPTKSPSLIKVFIFDEWDYDFSKRIVGVTNIYGLYAEKDRYYKLIYLDGNNNFFKEVRIEYGHKAEPITDIPVKMFVGNVAYKFTGWDFDFDTEIYQHYNIGSLFDEVPRWYTVRFLNYDSSLIEEQTVEYLKKAYPPLAAPEKPSSVDTVYIFSGWDKDINSITENLEVIAQYEEEVRLYEVAFIDGNGKRFDTQHVEYQQDALAPEGIPIKDSHDETAYKFTGWDKPFTNIESNTVVNAVFNAISRYYEVNFVNHDGTLLEKQTVEYLHAATEPSFIPTRDSDAEYNYVFEGWDRDFDCIEETTTVYAQYTSEIRHYEIIFLDGNGDVFDTQSVAYSQSAAHPYGTPRKNAHDDVAYKFNGWDKEFNFIVEDLVINAQFVVVDRYYTVTFVNYNDAILWTVSVEYFDAAEVPETPTREPETQYIYIFTHWDTPFDCVTENITTKAVYEQSLRPFSVKFIDGDNNVFNEQIVLYGQNAMYPTGTPTKSPYGDIAYRFRAWQGQISNITADTNVYATFDEVQRYYFVTFYGFDLSLVLKSERVEYGESAVAPEPPIPNHANLAYEYYFVGWDKSFSFVESDLVVTAVYSARMKSFTVTFVNGDETTEQIVNYGQNAVAPTPHKTGDNRVSYTFVGWDRTYTNVTQDITVTAIFEATYNYFLVTFINGDGTVMDIQQVMRGQNAVAPPSPSKPKTDDKVFIFTGWDRNFTDVQSDITVISLFKDIDRFYQVVFNDAYGNVLVSQMVEYSQAAVAPPIPVKESTAMYEYTFTGWDCEFNNVTTALIINPLYNEMLRKFEVKFIDGDGKIISTQQVLYGYSAIAPDTALKSPSANKCFVFAGWNKTFASVTTDMDVNAVFTDVDRWYTVTFMGVDDIVFYVQTVEYQKAAYDPIRDLEYQIIDEFTIIAVIGWDKTFDNITSNLTVNAIYNQIARWYRVRFYDDDGTELKEEIVEYAKSATPPADPFKEGNEDYIYEFAGWDKQYDFINQNLDVFAVYTVLDNKYTVKFFDGNGNLFDEQIVFYGMDATNPNGIPSKLPTDRFSYTFKEWDKALTNVRENRNIYALFEEHIRHYTVRFVNTVGQLLKEESVQYGNAATPPEGISVPEPTQQYYYEIAWSVDYKNITKDTVVQLIFNAVLRDYMYTFLDAEGRVLKSVVAPYGTEIVAPQAPAKQMTERYIYTFVCWTPELELILTKDVVFTPYYDESIREYIVTFLDGDNNVFQTQSVPYGSNGTLPLEIPQKTPTNQYYYEFRMWETYPNSIRSNTTIRSIFNSFLQMYTVTFVDEKDNVLKIHKVPYGTGATEPTEDLIPKKADTQMYTYTFVGWSRPFSNVTEDIVVKTVYIGIVRSYTYTFYDDDRITILKQVKAIYGSQIIPPPNPTKESTYENQYRFIGWDKVIADTLINNIDYYAVYEEIPKTFTVVFYDGNNFALSVQIINYGESAATPAAIPTKNMNQIYQYEFNGWIQDYSCVTSNLEIYPKFIEKLRVYSVKFFNYDNSVIEVFVEYGKSAEGKVPTPQKPGYRFVNWDKDITTIINDTLVYALFIPNQYQINFHPVNADSGYMPPIISTYDSQVSLPPNDFSKLGYHFVGWENLSGEIYFHDQESFVLDSEGLDLYARWLPIVYSITYHLDGGTAINPENYTIEDNIVLQSAHKEDHKFIGWYRQPPSSPDIQPFISPMSFMSMMSFGMLNITTMSEEPDLSEDEPIEEIPQGTMGNLELYAYYVFDGYITLKEDSELNLVTAEGLALTVLEERTFYDESNPIYIMNVFINMTVEQLRNNFINDGITVLRHNGTVAADTDKIGTGWQLVLYDEFGGVKDELTVILLGDLDGNGVINNIDINYLSSNIATLDLSDIQLLASNLDGNGIINNVDLNALRAMV